MRVDIKPLSVNKAWQGKRFKTKEYAKYERDVLLMLPKFKVPPPPYQLNLEYGFSNKASDADNPSKPFIDILQKKYGINDRDIYKIVIEKKIVGKGHEYIEFDLSHFENS